MSVISRFLLLAGFFLTSSSAFADQSYQLPAFGAVGEPVVLDPTDGFDSIEGNVTAWTWTWESRPDTSVADFDNPHAIRPTVTPDLAGTYVASLTVETDAGETLTLPYSLSTEYLEPVAQVFARNVISDTAIVKLDASQSFDLNGDPLSYEWSLVSAPAGETADIFSPNALTTDFWAEAAGTYIVGLTVTNLNGLVSKRATIEIELEGSSGNGHDTGKCEGHFRHGCWPHKWRSGAYAPNQMQLKHNRHDQCDDDGGYGHHGSRLSHNRALSEPQDQSASYGHGRGRGGHDKDCEQVLSRNVGPVADMRFDQLVASIDEAIVLDPYDSTDIDGDVLTSHFQILKQPDGANAVLSERADGQAHFVASVAGDYLIALNVSDGRLVSSDHVLIAVGDNESVRPVARISEIDGPDVGSTVALNGTQSFDFNGGDLSYVWSVLSKPDGSVATLSGSSAPRAELALDLDGEYTVQLSVYDSDGLVSVPATYVISVPNAFPVAKLGTDQVLGDANITLEGGLSTGLPTQFDWAAIGLLGNASVATLVDVGGDQVQLQPNRSTERLKDIVQSANVYHLKRSNGTDQCQFDTRVPSAYDSNGGHHQTSNAQGQNQFHSGFDRHYRPISMSGRGKQSGPSGYVQIWEVENKSTETQNVTLKTWAGEELASFVLPGRTSIFTAVPDQGYARVYAFIDNRALASNRGKRNTFYHNTPVCTGANSSVVQLMVANDYGYSKPDTIYVGSENIRPVLSVAATATPEAGEQVTLQAAPVAYDANTDALSYQWKLLFAPDGSSVSIDTTGDELEFSPDVSGLYLVQLEATDGEMIAVPSVFAVEIENSVPVAVATVSSEVFVGDIAVLDGSESFDADGNALTFAWTIASKPSGSSAQIADPTAAVTEFVPDVRGSYTFELIVSDFSTSSTAVTTTLNTSNRAPSANLVGAELGQTGVPVTFDATGSSDPDGDDLAYTLNVTSAPDNALYEVNVVSDGVFDLIGNTAGDYTVQLTVNDGNATDSVTADISFTSQNRAPVLEDLATPFAVEEGLTLNFTLVAVDPDGDAVSYFAQTLPLPEGMTLNVQTGVVSFAPKAGQAGRYAFTVGASDGVLTDSRDIVIDVVAPTGSETAVSGRVLDALDYAQGIETPLAGMNVTLSDSTASILTDAEGRFTFSGIAAGPTTVFVDPTTGGAGGYLPGQSSLSIAENQAQQLPSDILLTPLNDGCVTVVSGQDTVLTGSVDGLRVTIGADTIYDTSGNLYAGDVCLATLPQKTPVNGFPDYTQACQVYGVNAPGATFSGGVNVTAPNLDVLPSGTNLTLWKQDTSNGVFGKAASANVDTNGQTVSGALTALENGTLFTFLPQAPKSVASNEMPESGRSLSPFTGDMSETYALTGYRAFNQVQNVALSYHSTAANPTMIVMGEVTIASDASLPVSLDTALEVSGLAVNGSEVWDPRTRSDGYVPALVGEAVSLSQATSFDADGLASGRYGYSFTTRAHYECSTVSATHNDDLFIQNDSESPYGRGWSIDELQKLTVAPDGTVTVGDDDDVATFDPIPTLTDFSGEQFSLPALGPQGIVTSDVNDDGILEIYWADTGTGDIVFATSEDGKTYDITKRLNVAEPAEVPATGGYVPNLRSLQVGDLSGDGEVDLVYSLYTGKSVGLLEQISEDLPFQTYVAENLANFGVDLEVSDFTGDGILDLAYGELDTISLGYTAAILSYAAGTGNGLGNTRTLRDDFLTNIYPLQTDHGDLDGDQVDDIIFRTKFGFDAYTIGRPAGIGRTVVSSLSGIDRLGEHLDLGDINNDGYADVVIATASTLKVVMNTTSQINGTVTFDAPIEVPIPAEVVGDASVKILDANADGIMDILVSSDGTEDGIAIYPGRGDGTFEPYVFSDLGHGFDYLEIADVNGDGGLDLISSQRESVTVDFTNPSLTGHYIAGAGEFSELTQLADGTWERVYKDGTTVVFDTNGRQTATVDTYGNSISYVYDAEGRVASKTDQVGNTTVFEYDDEGYLASITYPDGRVTEFGYDNSYQLTEITDPSSATISFDYDENGRLASTTNANGNTSDYDYDSNGNLSGATLPNGSSIATQLSSSLGLIDGLGNAAMNPLRFVAPEDRLTTVTDRKGELTEIEVNQWGSVIRVTDPLGRTTLSERDDQNRVVRVEQQFSANDTRTTAITYDWQSNVASVTEAVGTDSARTTAYIYENEFNKVIQMTDPEGYVTSYVYDGFGQATLVTDPESGTMSYTYEDDGQLASRTDENGNATAFTYDADGNLLTTTFADGSVTATTYDDQGNTTVIAEAQGTAVERQVQRTYDALNRVLTVEVTGADGAQIDGITQYAYDAAGNLSSVTDETGLVTAMTYDELEQLVAVDDPAEGLIRRVYNEAGEVIGHINGDGETHTYAYDTVGRLIETTDPQGYVKTFAYDGRDNISTVVDGRGGETSFVYDALDRMVTRTNPIGLAMERAYDTRGMLTTLVREDGGIETAQYDGLGRRTSVTTLDNTLTYAYDPVGNLVEAQDRDSRVTFAYDARNRLITTTTDGTASLQPDVTLTYTYDALDRRMTMADSLGGTTTYSYDPEDRLADLTAPWGTVYSFGYDGEGRRTSLASTSGRQTTYGYTNGLLSALTHIQSGTTLTDLAYEYGPDGQLTAILDNLSPDSSRFISYDALNRLIQVDEGLSVADGGVPIPVEDYAYDEEGNRTASHLSTLYNSNAHNQLEEDSDHTYTYDARGNRISRTSKASGAVETYAYDTQNRLVGYANDTLSARYAYDALDRRIAKIIDAPDVPIVLENAFALSVNETDAVDIENITLTDDFTFEGWVRFDPGTTIDNIDGFMRNGSGQPTQDLNFAGGLLRLYMPGTGAPLDKIIAATPVVAGDWTHYALTRDASGVLKLYINGVLDVTAPTAFTRPLYVGHLGRTTVGASGAQFDDIRIWSVARSAADIAADLSSFIDPTTAGLERLYTFDANPGQVIDATGNSAPAALGTDVTLIPSTSAAQSAPSAPTTPGASAEVTAYVYDMSLDNPLAHDDIALEFQDGALTRRWVHSANVDEPLGFEDYTVSSGVGSGQEHAMYADRQGSVIYVTRPATGDVAAAYAYDAYGQITQTQGSLRQPYGYTGREYDAESGLYHYRARAYDPMLGLFMQADPVGFSSGVLGLYGYVSSDPANSNDPGGLTKGSIRNPNTGGGGNATAEFMQLSKATQMLRQEAIEHIAGGAFDLMLQAMTQAYATLDRGKISPVRMEKHHCLPKNQGGRDKNNLAKMGRIRHMYIHKLLRVYMRPFTHKSKNSFLGYNLKRKFSKKEIDVITDQFYRDIEAVLGVNAKGC